MPSEWRYVTALVACLGLTAGCLQDGEAQSSPEPDATVEVDAPRQSADEEWPIEPVSEDRTGTSDESGGDNGSERSSLTSIEARGKELFQDNCASCHGGDATGTGAGPNLRPIAGELARGKSEATVRRQIETGGKRMPSFSRLEDGEVDALVAYLTRVGDRTGDSIEVAGTESSNTGKRGRWKGKRRGRDCWRRGKKKHKGCRMNRGWKRKRNSDGDRSEHDRDQGRTSCRMRRR